uniref:Uncharacterized protein n=1 Tax=Globodera rostochiensis TaxID=31243 RepID=A0A914I9M8_GLORO
MPFTTIFCPITLFAIIYCCLATDPHEASEPFQQFMKQSALLRENGSKAKGNGSSFVSHIWWILPIILIALLIVICCAIRLWKAKKTPVANFFSKNKHVRGV